jgi:hypothetical protein
MRCAPAIDARLSEQRLNEQAQARLMLDKQFTSVRYLTMQGLALRGHESDNGNFVKLLRLRAADCTDSKMNAWLDRSNKFYISFCSE